MGAAEQFAEEFTRLYAKAGKPSLDSLIALAKTRRPQVELRKSTLSDWTRKGRPPQDKHALRFLVEILEPRAQQSTRQAHKRTPQSGVEIYLPRGPEWWEALRLAAVKERRAGAQRRRAAGRTGSVPDQEAGQAPPGEGQGPGAPRPWWARLPGCAVLAGIAVVAVALATIGGLVWVRGHGAQPSTASTPPTPPSNTKPAVAPCHKQQGTWYCYTKRTATVWADWSTHVVGHAPGGWQPYSCRNEGLSTHGGGPHPNRWAYTVRDDTRTPGWVADSDIYGDTDALPQCPLS